MLEEKKKREDRERTNERKEKSMVEAETEG